MSLGKFADKLLYSKKTRSLQVALIAYNTASVIQSCHLGIVGDALSRVLLLVIPDGAASVLGGYFMLKGKLSLVTVLHQE